MTPPNHFLVSLTILFSILILSPSTAIAARAKKRQAPTASSELVASVCNGKLIANRNFCLKVFNNAEAAETKSLAALAKVTLQLAGINAQDTLDAIQGELAAASEDPAPAIKSCMDSYEYLVTSFRNIFRELQQDAMTANYDTKVTSDEIDLCERGLTEAKVPANRLFLGNRFQKQYISIGNQITDMMSIPTDTKTLGL